MGILVMVSISPTHPHKPVIDSSGAQIQIDRSQGSEPSTPTLIKCLSFVPL